LRSNDELEASQTLLLALLEAHPDDPLVQYEVGGSYDVIGEDHQAIPYYMQAVGNGLDGDDLQECLVCLGSSLRYTGQSTTAVETLEDVVERFPDNQSGKVFLGMSYYSDGQYGAAVRTLLEVILDTTEDEDILGYEGALGYYKDNLDETNDV
ncbi:MAG: tetratricopeptide repeat protein, partial [Methylococcales bacterium]|nr:tetratricopeptide repeat protein [Methylococcales bacterium]